jgi:hypothetical protein
MRSLAEAGDEEQRACAGVLVRVLADHKPDGDCG